MFCFWQLMENNCCNITTWAVAKSTKTSLDPEPSYYMSWSSVAIRGKPKHFSHSGAHDICYRGNIEHMHSGGKAACLCDLVPAWCKNMICSSREVSSRQFNKVMANRRRHSPTCVEFFLFFMPLRRLPLHPLFVFSAFFYRSFELFNLCLTATRDRF